MEAQDQSGSRGAASSAVKVICGHEARGATGETFTCYLRPGHTGLHEEPFRLRDGTISRTNWGSDGLAAWATENRA